MTLRVRFTRDAVGDRERLEQFLAEQNPSAAERAMDVIADAVGQLSAYPRSGVDLGNGFYRLVVRFGTAGYELRYRLDDGDVIVVRVFHTREDR
jgi:plasmid stabilization system protein ParE